MSWGTSALGLAQVRDSNDRPWLETAGAVSFCGLAVGTM